MTDSKSGKKTKVFISYARKDMAWADWIAEALQTKQEKKADHKLAQYHSRQRGCIQEEAT